MSKVGEDSILNTQGSQKEMPIIKQNLPASSESKK
jgi:hypothetical protein